MENSIKSRLDTNSGFEITSVGQYLEKIKEIVDSEDGFTLFFRGQKTEYWDIQSSLFRENKLNIEHKLMVLPKSKLPLEFNSNCDAFDLMTKCQHYGLCTRLLDITTNPLVALYFACKSVGEEKYFKEEEVESDDIQNWELREPWGIIYYTIAYPYYSFSKEVQIVSALSQYNLDKENDLKDILRKLKNENIITDEDLNRWSKKENYAEFISIIQNNYTVIPISNNERIKRQSGAFLLPGMFSVIKDLKGEFQIYRSCKSLKDEFFEKFFYVDGDNKEKILKELDLCNINESTLFPELEHQLNYIKESNSGRYDAPDFVKYTEFSPEEYDELNELFDNYVEDEDEIVSKFKSELSDYLYSTSIYKGVEESLYSMVLENLIVDWYKKDSIKSKIRLETIKILRRKSISRNDANEIADNMLDTILNIYANNLSEDKE